MKTKTCKRCNGTGMRNTGVVHLGVPGLCYGCNGSGVLRFLSGEDVAAKVTKQVESHRAELAQRAEYVKSKIAKTKSAVLLARYEQELADLRAAYKATAKQLEAASESKGEWVA